MALLKFDFKPRWTDHHAAFQFSDFEYNPPVKFVSSHVGLPLPNIQPLPNATKGFSYDMSLPYVDFKALRACYESGCADVCNKVLYTTRRSRITTDYLVDSVLNYGYRTPPRLTDHVYQRCLDELRREFKVDEKITPLSLREAADQIPQNTSPGLPWINLYPSAKKGDIITRHFKSIERDWTSVGNGNRRYPLPDCAAFGRSHIGAYEKNKVRAVWVVPLTVVAAEARFALPIIGQLTDQTIGHHTAYGCEMMKGGMSWVHHQSLKAKYKDPGAKFLMTDYSSFDARVPAWLIRDCFSILREKMNLTREDANVWRRLVAYFINTPIQFADKRRLLTDHGVPSGSMWTNVIDTMVNFVQTRYLVYTLTRREPIFDVYFGDDGLIALPHDAVINLDDFSKVAKEKFGAIISPTKSYWTNRVSNIHFLGYFNNSGTPVKSLESLLASFLYPQHVQDDWAYTLSRAFGILFASAGNKTIFNLARKTYQMASHSEGKVEKAMHLVKEHPRMVRHFRQMGADIDAISPDLFKDATLTIPLENCRKLELGLDLVDGPS
uniref:RNA-dependent RNA polymerase n=1 Tax=Nefer virus TaxID=2800931 RepID=A0A894KQD1_9VIRU|nr:MAG: RNA-dependent RNA polymerase [Nefer virus]